jgi:hypothetical protein
MIDEQVKTRRRIIRKPTCCGLTELAVLQELYRREHERKMKQLAPSVLSKLWK